MTTSALQEPLARQQRATSPRGEEPDVVAAWTRNAESWSRVVRRQAIVSRRECTDQAIVSAVRSCWPRRVLDVGCGEGWLSHRLAKDGMAVIGIDAVPTLIAQAREGGPGDFRVMAYEALSARTLPVGVDVVVCNFSLLGRSSVEQVFRAATGLLNPGGMLLVQTVHPLVAGERGDYRDGWREESWEGLSDELAPVPWYFRTLESWLSLFIDNGFQLRALREPRRPGQAAPASLILIGQWRESSHAAGEFVAHGRDSWVFNRTFD